MEGQTDRQTDGIAVASTALAMRALWPAVKTDARMKCMQKDQPPLEARGDTLSCQRMLAFLFCLLPLTRYKAKHVKTHCFLEGVGQFEPRFDGEGVVTGEYFWFLQN